jgi:hypothetical protein
VPVGDHVDRSPFERGADALEDEPVRIHLATALQPPLDLVVLEERRQRRRHVLGVPDPRSSCGATGATLSGRAAVTRRAADSRAPRSTLEHARHYLRESRAMDTLLQPPVATAFDAASSPHLRAPLPDLVAFAALAYAPRDFARARLSRALRLASAAPLRDHDADVLARVRRRISTAPYGDGHGVLVDARQRRAPALHAGVSLEGGRGSAPTAAGSPTVYAIVVLIAADRVLGDERHRHR